MTPILHPLGLLWGKTAAEAINQGLALPLAGGPAAFSLVQSLPDRQIHPVSTWPQEMLHSFTLARDPPTIMGIVNTTPDSFSDSYETAALAIAHGQKLIDEGASIVDIGGESTRPGASPVSTAEEIQRVIPVIEGLKPYSAQKQKGRLLSIDTRNAETMQAAITAGIDIINDVSALTHHPESLHIAAASGKPVILMHMQGTPETMQENPTYENVVADIYRWLEARIETVERAGIDRGRLIIDPGIGFGKTTAHNIDLLQALPVFLGLGVKLMLGVSRKGLIAKLSNNAPPTDRLGGSLAVGVWGLLQGVSILRVHDVKETVQALKIHQALSMSMS